jgi:hypothetical protein
VQENESAPIKNKEREEEGEEIWLIQQEKSIKKIL